MIEGGLYCVARYVIMNTSTVYVLGHKHPDTDSICSAIGYAAYLNRNGGERYIPGRCGNLNAETKYALKKFGVEVPSLIMNVEPSVADLKTMHPEHALYSTPTFDVIKMMDQNDLRNLPITDDDGKLLGLISEHGLARAYVSNTKMETLSVSPIAVDDLARILHGKVFVKSQEMLEGTVYISIDALDVTLSHITRKDIAIVGNDESTQFALISAGIAALIIADSAPIGERIVSVAKEHEVTLIGTAADAFGTAKMIHMTLPARSIMTTDVPTVGIEDTLDYVKQVVSSSPYRAACILDADGRFVGAVSRNSLMEDVAKSVILLDHNEYTQAVDGIETADVVEIIDHHRLGAMSTLKPISFSMEPLGSTSTIIARRYLESGIVPSKAIAGILLSGILSDTLGLKMSTTTDIDCHIAERLAKLSGVDIVAYGEELISEGMALAGVSQGELQERDTKEFTIGSRRVVIAQILMPSYEFVEGKATDIYASLNEKLQKPNAPDVYVVLYTSVSEMGSVMYAVTKDQALLAALHWDAPLNLPGVVSRKKDFVPRFGRMLEMN